MKKNTFKRPTFKYEPIVQKKQPFWMHSIDKPTTGNNKDAIYSVIFILGMVALVYILGHAIYG